MAGEAFVNSPGLTRNFIGRKCDVNHCYLSPSLSCPSDRARYWGFFLFTSVKHGSECIGPSQIPWNIVHPSTANVETL